ncbi:hypothetical protein ACS0TY_010153 [Phlomoides rotata]
MVELRCIPERSMYWSLVMLLKDSRSMISTVYTPEVGDGGTFEFGQGNLKLLYSSNEGMLRHYTNKRNSVNADAKQSYGYYTGYNGTDRVFQEGNTWLSSHVTTFSAIDQSYTLPNNIALITLQELQSGGVLLRLAHLYEVLNYVTLYFLYPTSLN